MPWNLTGVNAVCVLCCTSALVWDNSSCSWYLLSSVTYNLCNWFSLSSNSPTVLALCADRPKSSLSSSKSYPLLSKIKNYCLFVSLCFEWTLSLPSLAILTFVVFIPLARISSSEISKLGLEICRCQSLHITNFVLHGKVEKGCWLQFTSVSKEIMFIVIIMIYYIWKVSLVTQTIYNFISLFLCIKSHFLTILVDIFGENVVILVIRGLSE